VTFSRRRKAVTLAVMGLLAVSVLCVAPFVGAETGPDGQRLAITSPSVIGSTEGQEAFKFWKVRVPQVVVSFLAGVGLALCGVAFQAMFRNPLATPFTLGVASGASLGASICVSAGLSFSLLGVSAVSMCAFLGAIAAIAVVYLLTRMRRGFSTATLLLAGVAVSFFCSSLIAFIQYMSRASHSLRIMHWLMGSMDVFGWGQILDVLPFVVVGATAILLFCGELNLLSTGEDIAASRGVAVGRVKLALFLITSLTVAGIVAICGPVGFVGMMIPHICRLLVGSEHRALGPAALLSGGTFLVFCDRLARVLVFPADMPVGIITALLGGPFFLWLLVRRGANWSL
jgi:iron complex transport system permease protein